MFLMISHKAITRPVVTKRAITQAGKKVEETITGTKDKKIINPITAIIKERKT
jgi:hypothetical protein